VKWYGKHRRKVSRIVKRYGNMAERQVELWKDIENTEEK
jgi:hypothetical protein